MTPSRKPHPVLRPLAAIALAVAAFAAPLASAQAAVVQLGPQTRPTAERHDDRQGGRDDSRAGARPNADRYGVWQNAWGARPPAPPRGFTRTADWHRHVRACQTRFRSYNPDTDRYTVRRGQTAVCRL